MVLMMIFKIRIVIYSLCMTSNGLSKSKVDLYVVSSLRVKANSV